MSDRPITSRSRGICRYYTTPRGCFAGKNCKFLHGEVEKITPYDRAKTCKFFAAGYCKRGADCWFAHVTPQKAESSASSSKAPVEGQSSDDDEHLCSICLEKPVTYGLLAGCSHIYCIQCIREWRDPNGKSVDVVTSGITKKCPLCRALSPFVTPSSHFYPDSNPGKEATIEHYKASMARVPCRYFENSPRADRFCPFGRDCFYQHLNPDGTPFAFEHGVSYYIKRRAEHQRRNTGRPSAHDDDDSPWVQDLSAAIDAIRASLPAFLQRVHDEDHPEEDEEDWGIDAAASEAGAPAHGLHRAALSQLAYTSPSTVSRTVMSEPGSPVHGLSFYRIPGDPAPLRLSPLLRSTESLPTIVPASYNSHPRFSTVVQGRRQDALQFGSIRWDFTSLIAREAAAFPDTSSDVLDASVSSETLSSVSSSSSESTDLSILPGPAQAVQHNREHLAPATHESVPADLLPAIPIEVDWSDGAASLHHSDPPLLTDGRGRVVWSTTPASRRGRGRAGSSAVPSVQQHKARRREGSMDGSEIQDHQEQPWSPHLVRARSFPEGSASMRVVTEGHGPVIALPSLADVPVSSPSLLLNDLD